MTRLLCFPAHPVALALAVILPASLSATPRDRPDPAVQQLRSTLLKQTLIPRLFSAEDTLRFRVDGDNLVQQAPIAHSVTGVVVDTVKLKGSVLEISGARVVVAAKRGKLAWQGTDGNMRLLIDLHGADPAAWLGKLPSLLFFPDLDQAVAALPAGIRWDLDVTLHPGTPKPRPEGCEAEPHLPQPVSMASPYSDLPSTLDMRNAPSDLVVNLTVPVSGVPQDVWIKAPIRQDWLEEVVRIVQTGRFKPATCDGHPVTVDFFMHIDWHVPQAPR